MADWLYERDDPEETGTNVLAGMHVPCCSVLVPYITTGPNNTVRTSHRPCHNGPLVGESIETGDCGEH